MSEQDKPMGEQIPGSVEDVKEKILPPLREKTVQLRDHLQDNTKTYLVGAVCFAAGYLVRKNPDVTMIVNDIKPLVLVDKLPVDELSKI